MRKAFTLIELLVVVSIIALLIAILLPALGAAKQSAVRIECLAKIEQVVTSSTSYAVDNKNLFLKTNDANELQNNGTYKNASVTGLGRAEWQAFEDYGFGWTQWVCPDWDWEAQQSASGSLKTGYIYTGQVVEWRGRTAWGGWNGVLESRSPVTLDDATSGMAMASDVVLQHSVGTWDTRPTEGALNLEYFVNIPGHGRDDDGGPLGSNHAFADGSGEWIDADRLMPLHNYGNNRQAFWHQSDIGVVEELGYQTPQ